MKTATAKKSAIGKSGRKNPSAPPIRPANAPNSRSTCWLKMPRRSDGMAIRRMYPPGPKTVVTASRGISHRPHGSGRLIHSSTIMSRAIQVREAAMISLSRSPLSSASCSSNVRTFLGSRTAYPTLRMASLISTSSTRTGSNSMSASSCARPTLTLSTPSSPPTALRSVSAQNEQDIPPILTCTLAMVFPILPRSPD